MAQQFSRESSLNCEDKGQLTKREEEKERDEEKKKRALFMEVGKRLREN